MQVRGFVAPGTEGGRLASADEIRQAVLEVRPELQVDLAQSDDGDLVRVSDAAGATVTFTTGAYQGLRADGQPYFRGWAWRLESADAAARPLERSGHWRALVYWPADVAAALAAMASADQPG